MKTIKSLKLICLLTTSISLLTGICSCKNEIKDKYGNKAEVRINQVDHIDEPDDFEDRYLFPDERASQKEKFNFNGKPGEMVNIVNPSPEFISAKEVEESITIKDGFASSNNPNTPMAKARKQNKSFTLCDPISKRQIDRLEPNGVAMLKLDEPTQGGDLTFYEKDEESPINFQGKDPSVNEYIVATEREDVEEFDPNTSMPNLLYSEVVDPIDLYTENEGEFIYSKKTGLNTGDQFFIGDNDKFDSSATYFTFLGETMVPNGYLIQYTVPDYSLCFNKFNVHKQDMPLDLEDENVNLKMPSKEEMIRAMDEDGGLLDLYESEVIPEMIAQDDEYRSQLFGPNQAYNPSLAFTINISRFYVNVTINFAVGGSSVVSNVQIVLSYMVGANDKGNISLKVGLNFYFKKTFSTYSDYSVQLLPYPKLNYIVAIKSLDELSVDITLGASYGMKDKNAYDNDTQKANFAKDINDALNDLGAHPDAKDEPTYSKESAGTGYYSGDGAVISLFGWQFPFTYVTLEVGVSVVINPILNGKVFFNYSKTSTTIICKVVNGFEVPEGYGDNVEYSRSNFTVGVNAQLGLELGLLFELIVYPTGLKAVFYAAIGFTVGVYIVINGVFMITWGDDIGTKLNGYASLEFGFFIRVNVRLSFLKGKFVVNFKAYERKFKWFAFGTNLHFLKFVKQKEEIDYVGGHYLNINTMGLLEMMYFNSDSLSLHRGIFAWDFKTYFVSYYGPGPDKFLNLFDDLKIKEGQEYVSFDSKHGWFEVKDNAPAQFTFKFTISIDGWLGAFCKDKEVTVNYTSDKVRAISFEGVSPKEVNGIHVGGGLLEQGMVYQAPEMEGKDGLPFYGWIGDNGLFLKANEVMTVGAHSIAFKPIYQPQPTYVVNFYDGYNNLISSQKIAPGGVAEEPAPEIRDANMNGAHFIGWDRSFDNVYSNFNVYAIYAVGGKNS